VVADKGVQEKGSLALAAHHEEVDGVPDEQQQQAMESSDEDDGNFGPAPAPAAGYGGGGGGGGAGGYGSNLMPGEGAAIAQFVQNNLRIPRRGEIGWEGQEIGALEVDGYVMSGSRHAKMNAVRIRKENQVYSAEEKKALAMIRTEEIQQKDNEVVADFRQMLQQRLRETAAARATAPPRGED
jgi:hypothetical protein